MDLTPAHQLAASRMFLTQEDVDDLIKLVKRVFDPVVIDIGAGTGNTALAVFQTIPDSIVYTIDNNQENLEWTRKNLEGFGIDITNWHPLLMEAIQIGGDLKYLDIVPNLVFHDADHEEQQVRGDLRTIIPVLSKGTIIWVHDYLPMPGAAETYPGVKVVCDELVNEKLVRKLKTTGIGFAAEIL